MGWPIASPPAVLDPVGVAIGVQFEPFSALMISAATAPTSQTVYGLLIGVTPGATLTGIKVRNAVAASGNAPTHARFGCAQPTSATTATELAISADTTAAASWGTGPVAFPFTEQLIVPSGVTALYACFVVNGTWSVTQPTVGRAGTINNVSLIGADGAFYPPTFAWTGQADLPAVGAALTISGTNTLAYYLAFY